MSKPMPEEGAYHVHDRAALRQVPWWNHLAYIQRRLPKALKQSMADLQLTAGSRVLDYGCADQPYRNELGAGIDYVGADLAGNELAALDIAPDGRLPQSASDFDVVLSTQVLEHVADPVLYLQESLRVLKPGGRILLSTHGMMFYHPDPVDYWRWTSAGLRKLFEDNGFVVESITGVIGLGATGLQFFQDAVLGRLPRFLRPIFCLVMQSLIRFADGMHSTYSREMNALVYIVNARKPDDD